VIAHVEITKKDDVELILSGADRYTIKRWPSWPVREKRDQGIETLADIRCLILELLSSRESFGTL
jgi:phage terminase Nu1 subunit (DNA packaging protein)